MDVKPRQPRTLLVIRHAKSDQHAGTADHDRPLNGRGRRDAPALGRWLRSHAPSIDVALCSSARRARQTWELAAAELESSPSTDVRSSLYLAGVGQVIEELHSLPDDVRVVALVGHEPTQSALTDLLAGTSDPVAAQALREGFVTAGVAVLELSGGWAGLDAGSCRLREFAAPRG